MRIQELEKKTGLDRATIRFYEKEGLVTPARQKNGYRDYSETDSENLLKIKLLRQLGMGLDKIRGLQQGREDFSFAMEEQISILSSKESELGRAKEVCREIRTAQTDYAHLDAAYYLARLARPAEQITAPKPAFRESVPREYHPVRRFVARYLDGILLTSLINFFVIVVLRVRPVSEHLNGLMGYVSLWLLVPVEALCCHFWGTTPGKWVMGLRLGDMDGGKPGFKTALRRAWQVFFYGCGLYIPIWVWWRQYQSYRQYREGIFLEWEDETEVLSVTLDWKRISGSLLLICLCISLAVVGGTDSVLPKHRGVEITISEFAENYNNYYRQLFGNGVFYLDTDGTWQEERVPNTVYVSEENASIKNFGYETENGVLTAITYDDAWTGFFMNSVIPDHCSLAALTVAGAQPGMQIMKLMAFQDQLQQAMDDSLENGNRSGAFLYGSIRVSWAVEWDNCVLTMENFLVDSDPEDALDSTLEVHFRIEILQ